MLHNIIFNNYSRTETHELLYYFLKKKNIPVSENLIYEWSLKEMENESLYGIGKFLSSLGFSIDGFKVKTIEELTNRNDIFSCIEQDNKTSIILIIQVDESKVRYLHPFKGIINENLKTFLKKWKNIIIISEIEPVKLEYIYKNLRYDQKKEIGKKLYTRMIISFIIFLPLIASYYYNYLNLRTLFLYTISYCGVFISMYVTKLNNFKNYNINNKLCNTSGLFNCNIYSSSNIPGWLKKIDFSVLSMSFFIGIFFILILRDIFNLQINYHLFYYYCAIAFTCFALLLQVFFIRKLCPYCLILMILVWSSLFLINIEIKLDTNFIIQNTLILILSFAIARLYSSFIKKISMNESLINKNTKLKFRNRENLNHIYKTSNKFLYSEQNNYYLGYAKASNIISLVISPFCSLCKETLLNSVSLVERNVEYKLRIIVCPYDNIPHKQQRKYDSLIRIVYSNNINSLDLIKKWCNNSGEGKLLKRTNNTQNDILNKMQSSNFKTCTDNNISELPVIFINDRLLPSEYSIFDIPFYINNLDIDNNKI